MIWLLFLLLAATVGLALWRSGLFTGATLQFVAAAMMLAAAGYIWQGRPGLPGSPAEAAARPNLPESAFSALRPLFFERFGTASRWITISQSYARRGETGEAVGAIRSGLRAHPRNVELWIALGDALVAHGGYRMNPAAELAFRHAGALAPNHPAPRFFYGLSLIEGGQLEAGESVWRNMLASAPADSKWRPIVADRLAVIDQLRVTGQLPPAR